VRESRSKKDIEVRKQRSIKDGDRYSVLYGLDCAQGCEASEENSGSRTNSVGAHDQGVMKYLRHPPTRSHVLATPHVLLLCLTKLGVLPAGANCHSWEIPIFENCFRRGSEHPKTGGAGYSAYVHRSTTRDLRGPLRAEKKNLSYEVKQA
jgi:hypothetical protein